MNDSRIAGYRKNKRTGGKFPVDKDGNPIKLESNKKEESKKRESKLTDEELKKEIGNDVTVLQKYAKEEGILPSELQDRLGITDRDLGFEDEYTKEFERDMQEKARYVMAEEAKKSPKTSSQDNIDNTYFDNYKKDQERLDNVINKMNKPVEKESPSRNYNKQSYIEAKSQVDREMRRDGDLSDDEYLKKVANKYADIEDRSPQDYDMKKILREVKEDALKAREEQRQSEKDNLLSGTFQKKETSNPYIDTINEVKKEQAVNYLKSNMKNLNDEQARDYVDRLENLGKKEAKSNTSKYDDYYRKENIETPSNYKPGDEIEFDTGYYSKLKGKVIREANDKDKRYQMNMNIKGYVVRDEYGFEHIVPDTRILNREKMVEKTDKAYKDNKPIIDSNKKTTNDYMNDKIRNNRKKSEDQIAREQLEKYKDKLKDPTKSKVSKADIKKTFKK